MKGNYEIQTQIFFDRIFEEDLLCFGRIYLLETFVGW